MSPGQIFLILLLIATNAFFVSVEFAVVASRRSRLDLLGNLDSRGASLVRKWLEDEAARDRLIAAAQLGITLASLGLGAAGAQVVTPLLAPYFQRLAPAAFLPGLAGAAPLLLALLLVTGIYVVLGEQVPKVVALRNPERFAMRSAPVMQVFIALFRGLILLLDGATRLVVGLYGLPASAHTHSSTVSLEDLKQIVSESEVEGVIDPPEREMLTAVIGFGDLVVRQVSVPRTEIIAVEADTPVTEAIRIAIEKGVTKLPVYDDNLDQVTSILHLKDLLPSLLSGANLHERRASELGREALFVPESLSVTDLLVQMRDRKQHMAITLDEFGGTAGLVTLEDLLEEIVGEVHDPFDAGRIPTILPLPDGTALVDGLAQIENINERFGLSLSDPNYDTIAGYMLGKLGRLAQPGDQVEDAEQAIKLRVDSMDRLRIARIHLSRL